MEVFVVLAVVLALAALGAVVAAAVALKRQSGVLAAQVQRTQERLKPLVDEFNDELAVTTLETEAIARRTGDS